MKKESVLGVLKENYLIILICILGVIPRFYALGKESIWYDEAVSIVASKMGFADIIAWIYKDAAEANPPFYYLLMSVWIPVFGDTEFITRVPAAVFGSFSVFAIYAVGKLLYDKKTGLIAALILAVSVFHIRYAQEVRGYTLMVFLILVSFYSFLQLSIKRRTLYEITYIASTVLLVCTHYYGVLIVLSQNIFCFTLILKNKRIGELGIGGWLKLQLISGILLLPCIFLLAVTIFRIRKGFWIAEPTSEYIWQYFEIYSGSIYLLILFLGFSLYAVYGARKVKGRKQRSKSGTFNEERPDAPGISGREKIYLLLLWLLVPVLIPFLISFVFTPILVFRYTIGASLAFYLLVSKGIGNLNNKWLILAAAGLIVILSCVKIGAYYKVVGKHQWREVMSYIESKALPGDVIIVSPIYERITARYYKKRNDIQLLPLEKKFPVFKDLGNGNIWFVFHAHPDSRANSRAGLGGRYDITEKHYYKLDLFQLREKRTN